jgi:SSS family solute:Na+ symporter
MIVTSIVAVVFIMFTFFGSPAEFSETIRSEHPRLLEFTWTPELYIGITLPWAFFALTNPQVSQRMYVPDKMKNLKRMIMYFAAFGFLYTIIATLFGYQAAHIVPGLENADQAMPRLLAEIPTGLALIIFVGIFAAASSTLGSIILTLSSLFSRDIARNLRPDISEGTERWIGRLAIFVLLVACIVFAWFRPGLITVLSSMASGGLLVMAPTIIAAFFWKRATAPAAIVSMAVGGAITAVMYLANIYPLGWWPSVWGLLITSILFVAITLFTTPPRGAGEFIDNLERELTEKGFRLERKGKHSSRAGGDLP